MSQNVINEHTDENIKNYLSEENENDLEQERDSNSEKNNRKNILKSKKVIFVIVLLIAIIGLSLFYFMRLKGKQSFDETKVKVSIETLNNIASGEEIVFDVKYENNTSVDLRNVKVSFFVPDEFLFISSDQKTKIEETVLTWNFENISSGESGNIKLFGKITGELDEEYNFNSKISYTPANFNYEFESADEYSKSKIKIAVVTFEFCIQSPEDVIS